MVALSTLLRAWAALRVPTPWISADEQTYAELGRSLYESGRLEVLGAPSAFYGLVYPALVGAPLAWLEPEGGYDALKLIQAFAMSLAAVPVYCWGRQFVTPRWSLVAAALTLTLPGLAYAGLIMTEVAFYPVVALTAWALASALASRTLGMQLVALAAIVVAILTRLQALAILPAVVTAVVLQIALPRAAARGTSRWEEARAYAPLLVGTAALALGWVGWRLGSGGPATEVLGAYRAAGETSYDISAAMRFLVFHAADLVFLCGVLPACAVALLAAEALRRGERSPHVRAYLAVTISVSAWFVAEVGVFASRHVGRLAERDLIALAPLLFLGFALWLERGAPRPQPATTIVAFAALVLIASVPFDDFTSLAAIPDAFTLIPLYKLEARAGDVNLDLLVGLLALAALLVFVLVPRKHVWLLAALVGGGLAAISISASRVIAGEATLAAVLLMDDDQRWIDRAADGPVTYLYAGEALWTGTWANQFWNRQLRVFYDLPGAKIPGPLPQSPVGPRPDGTLVFADGRPAPARYVVATRNLVVRGERVSEAPRAGLVLWRTPGRVVLDSWTVGRDFFTDTIAGRANVSVYDCSRVDLNVTIAAPEGRRITVSASGRRQRSLHLPGKTAVRLRLRARRAPTQSVCTFEILSEGGGIGVSPFRFARR